MNYRARPAWRNDWILILVIFTCFTTPLSWGGEIGSLANYLPLLAIPLIVLVAYRHYVLLYTVDEQKIESRRGIIARHLEMIRIEDLRNVSVDQTVCQRIFMLGDVGFSSAGGGGIEVMFRGVSRPVDLKTRVEQAQREL
ncbi:MAG: PH domain-containing protein [Myxococcota bacterium]|nr:PH domain-containing protein [Myxococcota bacterium]